MSGKLLDITVRVAYLTNQYPLVSHSFIRREILALERRGAEVLRISVRGWDAELADAEDLAERKRTRYVLRQGLSGLMPSLLRVAALRPARFAKALRLALLMAGAADKRRALHLVYLAEACRILEWVVEWRAEHIHAHFGTNPAEVALLVQALGGPAFSFTAHREEFDKAQLIGLKQKIEHAAFVVAVSSFGRSQLFRWMPAVEWPKVKVVRCGLETRRLPSAVVPPPSAPVLVCVGRLCEQKGQLLLVEAAHVLAQRGIDVRLRLVGDGPLRGELEALIAERGLQRNVELLGWRDGPGVFEAIAGARALVLPSFSEGLPVVLMESMLMRRPVISTYVGGIPELVRPGVDGWLVPAGDVGALADAMADCLAAPSGVLVAMGERARERVLKCHDIDAESGKLLAHFEDLAAAHAAETRPQPHAVAAGALPPRP